jgi:hypothetical protein
MKFPKITSQPVGWKTSIKAPRPTPVVAAAAGPVAGIKRTAGVRTQEQAVARQLYYSMSRAIGIPKPPSFSGLHSDAQRMWLYMASDVIQYLSTQLED